MADSRFSTMMKASKDAGLVGQVHSFRVIECDEAKPYYIVKSTDAEKKSKNFVALLPKCMVSNFSDFLNIKFDTES